MPPPRFPLPSSSLPAQPPVVKLNGCRRCDGSVATDRLGELFCVNCGQRYYSSQRREVRSDRERRPSAEPTVPVLSRFGSGWKRWTCWPVSCLMVAGRHVHVWSWDYSRSYRARSRSENPGSRGTIRYHACQLPGVPPRWAFESLSPVFRLEVYSENAARRRAFS